MKVSRNSNLQMLGTANASVNLTCVPQNCM